MKTENDELVIDSAKLAEISKQAEENYEMIQYMINSAGKIRLYQFLREYILYQNPSL